MKNVHLDYSSTTPVAHLGCLTVFTILALAWASISLSYFKPLPASGVSGSVPARVVSPRRLTAALPGLSSPSVPGSARCSLEALSLKFSPCFPCLELLTHFRDFHREC